MRKFLLILVITLCSQFVNAQVSYYPINLQIQKIDTAGKEIYFVKYDTATGTTIIRGDFKEAVKDIGELNRAQADLVAASRLVMAQLYSNGTVKNRTQLTAAIAEYNRVKLKYGITW